MKKEDAKIVNCLLSSALSSLKAAQDLLDVDNDSLYARFTEIVSLLAALIAKIVRTEILDDKED